MGILTRYEPNVQSVIAYLQLLKVPVNARSVDTAMQDHPDFPSLLCVSDALSSWCVDNAAIRVAADQIDTIPTPFLAYLPNDQRPLRIVERVFDSAVVLCQINNRKKKVSVPRDRFLSEWSGICLFAEPSKQSGETDYLKKRRVYLIKQWVPVMTLLLLVTASFFAVANGVSGWPSIPMFSIYLQLLLFLMGIGLSSLLVGNELFGENLLLAKVCGSIHKGNCQAVLSSKQAKLFGRISWSEIGLLYFAGGTLLLLIGRGRTAGLIGGISEMAVGYTLFSIYLQWRVIKQWCILCLCAQGVLVACAANALLFKYHQHWGAINLALTLTGIFSYVCPLLIWLAIRPYLVQFQEMKSTRRKYIRFKFSKPLFKATLERQRPVEITTDGLGIELGDPAASNTLIKVCNPYCGPCARVHPQIEELLHKVPNLKAKIIFATPNEPDSIFYKPVSHLLTIAEESNNRKENIAEALNTWYDTGVADYSLFAKKYPVKSALENQAPKIAAMDQWCQQMKIRETPTIFFNGFQLPDTYELKDLEYFLSE